MTDQEFDEISEAIRLTLCQVIGIMRTHFPKKQFIDLEAKLWDRAALLRSGDLTGKLDDIISELESQPVNVPKQTHMERMKFLLEKAMLNMKDLKKNGTPVVNRESQLFIIMERTEVGNIYPFVFSLPTALTTLLEHWRTRLNIQVMANGRIDIAGIDTYTQEEVLSVAAKLSYFKHSAHFGREVNWQSYEKPWLAFQEAELAFCMDKEVEKAPQKFMECALDILKEYQKWIPAVTICGRGWPWRYDSNVCAWVPELMGQFSADVGVVMEPRPELEPSCVYHAELEILVFGHTYENLKRTCDWHMEVWGLQFCFSVAEFYRRQDEIENGSLGENKPLFAQTTDFVIANHGEAAVRELLNSIVMPFGSRTMARMYDTADIEDIKPHIPTILIGFNLFKAARERKRAAVYLDVAMQSPDQQNILRAFGLSEIAVAIGI